MKLEPVLNVLSQCGELPSRTEQIDDLKWQLEASKPSERGKLVDTIKALQEEKLQLEVLVAKAAKAAKERDALEQEHNEWVKINDSSRFGKQKEK
jgi:hypothetical protein